MAVRNSAVHFLHLFPPSFINIHSNVTLISLRQISFPSKFLDHYFECSCHFSLRAFCLAHVVVIDKIQVMLILNANKP